MIVSFSGIDSAGKTTQINLLEQYCINNKIKYRKIWAKARGTPGIEFVKNLVRRDKKMSMEQKRTYRAAIYKSYYKQKILLMASFGDLVWYFGIYYRILARKNEILILDRYLWDTYIETKCEFDQIEFENWFIWKLLITISPRPDVSVLYIIPSEESLKRDIQKGDLFIDSIEQKKNKIDLYMKLVNKNKWTNIINGMQSVNDVWLQTILALHV